MRKCFFTAKRANRRAIKRKQDASTGAREFYRHVSISWIRVKKKKKQTFGTKGKIKHAVT